MIRNVLLSLVVGAAACASNASYQVLDRPAGPLEEVEAVLYLVGDAGHDSPGRDAVLQHLRRDLLRHVEGRPTTPALVAFLGDNIYEVGARLDFRAEDLEKLAAQVRAVVAAPTVRGVFLPGNHDWGHGAADPAGRTAIEIQQEWIEEIQGARDVRFLPADECPGPETVALGDAAHLVFIDTEWLLRRPGGCGGGDRFYDELTTELRRLRGERVILLAHHPMATGGPHGGNVGLFDSAPVVYYLAVKSGLSVQDLASGRYSAMLDRIREAVALSGTRPLAIATGHDHSLQVIRMERSDEPVYQLVSGSASKTSKAARIEGTRYATSAHGYMRVDFTGESTRVVVFALVADPSVDPSGQPSTDRSAGSSTDTGPVRPVFSCTLSPDAEESCEEAPLAGAVR